MKRSFDLQSFSEKVATHRSRSRLSLREAAKEVKVSAATLNRIEQGKMPDVETFFRCCKWMIIPTDLFFKNGK